MRSRAEVEADLRARLARLAGGERLEAFIRRISPTMPPAAHMAPLIKLIERSRLEPVRACVSWPPRHGKTSTLLHGIAWLIERNPADTCAFAAYGDALARSKSRVARRAALEARVPLAEDSASVSEWRTKAGGGLLATGVGGPLTGQGITGLLVVDDAVKNRAEADSPTFRDTTWEWFNEVAITRLQRGASVIVSGTRWHDDDLIGRLERKGGWEMVRLPALAEAGDPLGRAVGDPLWPEQFPAEALEAIRAQIGEWSFAALYQQRPQPRGAAVFGPAIYFDPAEAWSGYRVVIGADPAATESTRADHSVAVVLAVKGYGPTSVGRVLEVVREQVKIPAFVRTLRALSERHGNAPIAVEAVGGFKAIPQLLAELDPRLRLLEVKMTGDKFVRAQAVAAAWNAGRVQIPRGARWAPEVVAEIAEFTGAGDRHDDVPDALAHAWNAAASSLDGVAAARALAAW